MRLPSKIGNYKLPTFVLLMMEHARLTERQFAADGVVVEHVGVDTSAPGPLWEVGGPIVAWPELRIPTVGG